MKDQKTQLILAVSLAVVGGFVYLWQSWNYANTQVSVLDEGAYLVKGWMFARGEYKPYQDYGFLTNHMPLSFLIPGYVQLWFGPGIRTARVFALAVGMLFLIGLWVANRRLVDPWWATFSVWVIALNPALIKIYSVAVSQVLVACMLAWVLALAVGEGRSRWEVLGGTALAALLLLTRINLAPVVPLLLLYIFWQHGKALGTWAALVSGSVLLAGHLVFAPGILRMWAYWLPEAVAPFLAPWRQPLGIPKWDPSPTFQSRLLSFFQGVRYHFAMTSMGVGAWLLWPGKNQWKNRADHRAAALLSALFGISLVAHIGASLGLSYCTFCFPVYQGFYSFLGLLLGGLVVKNQLTEMRPQRGILVALTVILVTTGLGYSTLNDIGRSLLTLKVPRVQGARLQEGTIELWGLLANKFGFSYSQFQILLPTLAGLSVGIGVLLAALGLSQVGRAKRGAPIAFGTAALALFTLLGVILTPTHALGGAYQDYEGCGPMIASYEAVGTYLKETIPPGSRIYWQGGLSAVPLLYLEDPKIFPAQINMDYSFRFSGEDDALSRYGLWSEPLARSWLMGSDYALVARRYYKDWLQDTLENSGVFEELPSPPLLSSCDRYNLIHVFRRIR